VPRYDSETDVFFNGRGARMQTKTIVNPAFYLPSHLAHYGPKVSAHTAVYLPAEGDRPGGYLMDGVELPERLYEKPSISLPAQPGLDIPAKPVLLTAFDHDWLKPRECFVVTGVDFEQLTGGKHWRQYSSTLQMIDGMKNPSLGYGADVKVEVHSRFVQPFLDITLLFLGLPLVLAGDGRNMFLAVGRCVLIVVMFMAVVMGSQLLGTSLMLSPALAAWCPLMIFVPMAVGMSEPFRQ